MYRARRLGNRVRRLLEHRSAAERARLDGLEIRASGFGEWLEAGGERRKKPRRPRPDIEL